MANQSRIDRLEAMLQALMLRVEQDADSAPIDIAPPDVLADCFTEQLAFISDESPMKAAFCTRRAAKSYSVGLDFISDAQEHPRAHYLILGLHRQDVKDIYWDNILKEIDYKYGLQATFNEAELTMRLPNGAMIRLAGADANEKEKRKFLGGKKRKVAVDESQSFGSDLRELVMGVLKPSVADYNGQIVLVGTPGNLTAGFFHHITAGCKAGKLGPESAREPGWSLHTWTTFQNTALVDGKRMCDRWKEEIQQLLNVNPAIKEVPWFRQNYLGEWVVDRDALCYKFDLARNGWNGDLPKMDAPHLRRGSWHYVLAVDLGYHPDPSAFAVLAYHDFLPDLFVLETWKEWRMDITDVANKTRAYEKRFTFDAYVIDGANKQAVEEMRRRHNLPFTDADKRGKADFIELMNAEFVLSKIKVNTELCAQGRLDGAGRPGEAKVTETLALTDEYAGLIWDPRKIELGKREEHPGCANHLCDAVLYGWRYCYQYLSQPQKEPSRPFTPEWLDEEVQRMMAHEQEVVEQRKRENMEGLGDSSNWESWA